MAVIIFADFPLVLCYVCLMPLSTIFQKYILYMLI